MVKAQRKERLSWDSLPSVALEPRSVPPVVHVAILPEGDGAVKKRAHAGPAAPAVEAAAPHAATSTVLKKKRRRSTESPAAAPLAAAKLAAAPDVTAAPSAAPSATPKPLKRVKKTMSAVGAPPARRLKLKAAVEPASAPAAPTAAAEPKAAARRLKVKAAVTQTSPPDVPAAAAAEPQAVPSSAPKPLKRVKKAASSEGAPPARRLKVKAAAAAPATPPAAPSAAAAAAEPKAERATSSSSFMDILASLKKQAAKASAAAPAVPAPGAGGEAKCAKRAKVAAAAGGSLKGKAKKGAAAAAPAEAAAAAPSRWPFPVDYNDHFETSSRALADIEPVLARLALALGKSKGKLVIYDPFYCKGAVRSHLARLGYHTLVHECRNFYADVDADTVPNYDILVTNPPYSADHKERCLQFCAASHRPWALLLPNYVATKQYYTDVVTALHHSVPAASAGGDAAAAPSPSCRPFYGVPGERYSYDHPEGTGHAESPFASIWYLHLGGQTRGVLEWLKPRQVGGERSVKWVASVADLQASKQVPTAKRRNPKMRQKLQKLWGAAAGDA